MFPTQHNDNRKPQTGTQPMRSLPVDPKSAAHHNSSEVVTTRSYQQSTKYAVAAMT